MISHYYLQRTELRTDRHWQKWTEFASEVGADRLAKADPGEYARVSSGALESAYTSSKFLRNAVLRKRRQMAKEEAEPKDLSKD